MLYTLVKKDRTQTFYTRGCAELYQTFNPNSYIVEIPTDTVEHSAGETLLNSEASVESSVESVVRDS